MSNWSKVSDQIEFAFDATVVAALIESGMFARIDWRRDLTWEQAKALDMKRWGGPVTSRGVRPVRVKATDPPDAAGKRLAKDFCTFLQKLEASGVSRFEMAEPRVVASTGRVLKFVWLVYGRFTGTSALLMQ